METCFIFALCFSYSLNICAPHAKPARFHTPYTSPQIPIIISTTSLIMLIAFWWRGCPILCASALRVSSRLKSSTIHSPASKAMPASTESATPINCGKNAMKNKISFGLLKARNSPCVKHLRALRAFEMVRL